MNQLTIQIYWILNKIAVLRRLLLPEIACTSTKEEEVITIWGDTWVRAAGTWTWEKMKPLAGNLPTG